MRKLICYIVYGDNDSYYNSAKFSILTLLNYTRNTDVEIAVLTSNVNQFRHYPVSVYPITKQQEANWSLNHRYNFRIKNLGLQSIIENSKLSANDKILFFDTDIYFKSSPLILFEHISKMQAIMYKNEGMIYQKSRFNYYQKKLQDLELCNYSLDRYSCMWGSAIIGISASNHTLIQEADHLMTLMLDKIDVNKAHTIEQFSLAEVLRKKLKLIEGKKHVSIFSTSKQKRYALPVIEKFLAENKNLDIKHLSQKSLEINLNRSIFRILKDKIYD